MTKREMDEVREALALASSVGAHSERNSSLAENAIKLAFPVEADYQVADLVIKRNGLA